MKEKEWKKLIANQVDYVEGLSSGSLGLAEHWILVGNTHEAMESIKKSKNILTDEFKKFRQTLKMREVI